MSSGQHLLGKGGSSAERAAAGSDSAFVELTLTLRSQVFAQEGPLWERKEVM